MRRPIVTRAITGERRLPRRRRSRRAHTRLCHPLALLYRQSRKPGTTTPVALRAADGTAVPIAPRLQIALHLSFTLNEQYPAFHVSRAPDDRAPGMPAAPVARASSTFLSFPSARHSAPQMAPRYRARHLSGHSPLAWVGNRAAVADAAASPPRPSNDPVANSHTWIVGWHGVAAAVGPRLVLSQERFVQARSIVSRREGAEPNGPAPDVRILARPLQSDWPSRTRTTVLQHGRAGPGRVLRQISGRPASRLISPRRPAGTAFVPLPQPDRPPHPPHQLSTPSRSPGAPRILVPLHFTERLGARSAERPSFSSASTSAPLEFRSTTPPPAPPLAAQAPPAAATAPRVAAVDLEAVSRDVLRRIEKRLRIERERRGRS